MNTTYAVMEVAVVVGTWAHLHQAGLSAATSLGCAGCLCLTLPLLQHQKCCLQRLRQQIAAQHAAAIDLFGREPKTLMLDENGQVSKRLAVTP